MKGLEPGIHEKIIAMAMNGSGCRETSRVLGTSLNMVLKHLKKLNPLNRVSVIDEINTIIISAVMDEQWSFFGTKKKLRWLFYVYDRVKRKVLCHVFGRRTKATLNRLSTLLDHASICYFMTDAWPVYLSVLLAEKHIIGKR